MNRTRTAILISGRGSNMEALISAAKASDFPAEAALVLANKPEAKGLKTAAEAGVETAMIDHRDFAEREAFERAIDARLNAHEVELVALAGFMRVLTPWFVARWAGRLINIHPSLLPSFPGLDTHQRAIDSGAKLHGCTVHFVTPGVDEGPPIGQAVVPVHGDDTADSLSARVLVAEHALYPACLAGVASGDLTVRSRILPQGGGRILINAPG